MQRPLPFRKSGPRVRAPERLLNEEPAVAARVRVEIHGVDIASAAEDLEKSARTCGRLYGKGSGHLLEAFGLATCRDNM